MKKRILGVILGAAVFVGATAPSALAWTAPVIIDSLASPAAAGSLAGCYRAEFQLETG